MEQPIIFLPFLVIFRAFWPQRIKPSLDIHICFTAVCFHHSGGRLVSQQLSRRQSFCAEMFLKGKLLKLGRFVLSEINAVAVAGCQCN